MFVQVHAFFSGSACLSHFV